MPLIALFLLLVPALCFSAACPELSAASARERLEQLGEEVRYHDRLYYQELRPVIADAEYDRLFGELLNLEECFPTLASPDSPTRRVGGGVAGRGSKVAHEHPMLSLTSSAGPESVEALLRRTDSALLVQPKVDGLPVELVYVEGRLVSAATRGDGFLGEEVTARVRQIQGVPMQLSGACPARVVVRGEIYADRHLLADEPPDEVEGYATLRHLAAATLLEKVPDPRALAALRLFTFALVKTEPALPGIDSGLAELRLLAAWGFPVPPEHTHPARSLDEVRSVYREYLARRDEQPFAMDGIVVKVDNLELRQRLGESSRAPLWAAAWKFPPATARTEILAIRWSVGRTGRRTPVAEITPVDLGGIRVRRVSLHSASEVDRLRLAVGDQVVVALAGDAVPQIEAVVGKKPGAENPSWLSVSLAEPAADACLTDAPGCREQFLARTVHFASKAGLGIAGLGKGRLQALVEAGLVDDLSDLFRLQPADIAALPGFGTRRAEKLTAAIAAASRPPLPRLLAALGIPGVGPVAVRRLSEQFSTLDLLLAAEEKQLAAIPGIGTAAAKNLHAFFVSPGGRKLLEEFRELAVIKRP